MIVNYTHSANGWYYQDENGFSEWIPDNNEDRENPSIIKECKILGWTEIEVKRDSKNRVISFKFDTSTEIINMIDLTEYDGYAYYDRSGDLVIADFSSYNARPIDEYKSIGYIHKLQETALLVPGKIEICS